ncbi:uncharacterized protein LOC142334797 [Convolutriloba macropyga]|uniref:uncharacterized protein LOC142334797 n=1 Tax=Convolutriloba macropyga TaxID=536237 RepID=UPI003F526089
MGLDLRVVFLLFGLWVSVVLNEKAAHKSNEKYVYTKFEGYDIELEQTKKLNGREIAKIKSSDKKNSDLVLRCEDKCSERYESDCNIIIYKADENQCLLMDCGENAENCYFISSEDSKRSGKGGGDTIILQRSQNTERVHVKENASDAQGVSNMSSSAKTLVRKVPAKVNLTEKKRNSSARARKKSIVTETAASHSNAHVAAKKLKSWKEGAIKLTNMAARLSGRSLLNSNRTPARSNTTTRNVSRMYVSPPVTVMETQSKKSQVVERSVSSSTSLPVLTRRVKVKVVDKNSKGLDFMGVESLQSTKHYTASRPSQHEANPSTSEEENASTAEAEVETQKRKDGEVVVVGKAKPTEHESDPFSFPASPNDDGSDPAIQGPFEETSSVPQCEQPQRVGPCRAAIPRFFYDKETKACVAFIFGGCNPNDNNFKTNEECIRTCANQDGVKYFNTNNQQHTIAPYNSAHRGLISTHGSSNLNTAYKLEALIPLFAGSMISLLMVIMIGFRCYVNSKTGPKKLRKMVYDGPPPTVGEFLTDDEIVNGMYT